jgi:hypothetical protein
VAKSPDIKGDESREALSALGGYVYQLYQSALAWVELGEAEILFLEVAEDYATVVGDALNAVQVKNTKSSVTINSAGVVQAIDSLITLTRDNPDFQVNVRYLTTSEIGREKSADHRVNNEPTLAAWRRLAKAGDVSELARVLALSNISDSSKSAIASLDELQFREQILRRLQFDCGAPNVDLLRRALRTKLLALVKSEGGTHAQMQLCEETIIGYLLKACAGLTERTVDKTDLLGIVQQVTRVTMSQGEFERQTELVNSALSAAVPSGGQVDTRGSLNIREVPSLPRLHHARENLVSDATEALQKYGLVWLHGATGMGKTLLARLSAHNRGGRWFGATLRGLDARQTSIMVEEVADNLADLEPVGIILDDLEHSLEQSVVDALQYLLLLAERKDVLVIVTSSGGPSSKAKYLIDEPDDDFSQRVPEFSEDEVGDLIEAYGGNSNIWSRYVTLASGGGHPQLVQALIQNLRQRGWPLEELKTLSSLLEGNPAVEEIRQESRRRLLRELPQDSLTLLQRLSLKIGRFRRQLVIDVSLADPPIPNGGFMLDDLVGPWVDQVDADNYQLSPLLSGLAGQALSQGEQKRIHSVIADSLTQGPSLKVSDMQAAVTSATISQNKSAVLKFCMATLQSSHDDLETISEYNETICLLNLDKPNFDDSTINQMFRGVQLLLCANGELGLDTFDKLIERFELESSAVGEKKISVSMELLIYSKILMSTPKKRSAPRFTEITGRLHTLLKENGDSLPPEMRNSQFITGVDDMPVTGFVFLLQLVGVQKIEELIPIFEFVDNAEPDLRSVLLQPLNRPEFDADKFVQSAWLAEHRAGTIDAPRHTEVFKRLEAISRKWGRTDIAVVCCKYQAIILDEYGGQKDEALRTLEAGLNSYGATNSELVRAKAKVFYRANDYETSLNLARVLIENHQIENAVERAFLGREAAISAEKQGDMETARKYYLYARSAAQEVEIEDMTSMATGLLADAALAAWHAGDQESCLLDFMTVLSEVVNVDPKSSLRTAHVRAVTFHVLLWLDQEVTGETRTLNDGLPTQIYPGVVSNPEPHEDIGKHPVQPIEMGWYMLAKVECESGVDISLTKNLDQHLPNGELIEGETLISQARMGKALVQSDAEGFFGALKTFLMEMCHIKASGGAAQVFNVQNPTYGRIPIPSREQMLEMSGIAELHALVLCACCLVSGNVDEIADFISKVRADELIPIGDEFLVHLDRGQAASEPNRAFAAQIALERLTNEQDRFADPSKVCHFAINLIHAASHTGLIRRASAILLPWYKARWCRIARTQRFLMTSPMLYADGIEALVCAQDSVSTLTDLVLATLPATKFRNQADIRSSIEEIRKKHPPGI